MSSRTSIVALLAWGACVLASPLPARAQQPPAGCTYDRCAIRFDEPYVVRGLYGERIAKLGTFSVPRLRAMVQGSDTAMYFAGLAEDQHRNGVTAGIIGTLVAAATGIWLVSDLSSAFEDGNSDPSAGIWVSAAVGAALGAVSQYQLRQARRSLAHAIWWYNRDLPR